MTAMIATPRYGCIHTETDRDYRQLDSEMTHNKINNSQVTTFPPTSDSVTSVYREELCSLRNASKERPEVVVLPCSHTGHWILADSGNAHPLYRPNPLVEHSQYDYAYGRRGGAKSYHHIAVSQTY